MAARGEAGWKAVQQKAFGKERWPELHKSLKAPVEHVALVNPFLSAEARARYREERGLQDHPSIPLVCAAPTAPLESEVEDGLTVQAGGELTAEEAAEADAPRLPAYFLDGASAVAALCMQVQPGDRVLDLCAAPGGKSLMMACRLFAPQVASEAAPTGSQATSEQVTAAWAARMAAAAMPEGGLLVCNEASKPRAQRLERVLRSFLPAELIGPPAAGGRVAVTLADATAATPPTAIQRLGPYDKILVDAPCTSDRHLVHDGPSALAKWATGVVKSNAERQVELLRCAAKLLKPGGSILYSTCALSEQENDGVVDKFLKQQSKSGPPFAPAEVTDALVPQAADRTQFGILILPDRTPYGPIFFAHLRRL